MRTPRLLDAREIGPGWDRAWPLPSELLDAELAAYLDGVADQLDQPSRCDAWDGRAVTAHLAATFERIAAQLDATRAGDRTPPFRVTALGDVNARDAATIVHGPDDEVERLRTAVAAVLATAGDPDEPIAHQRGLVPVGLQLAWLLGELAIHHDDVRWPDDGREPSSEVVATIAPAYEVFAGIGVQPMAQWRSVMAFTGR